MNKQQVLCQLLLVAIGNRQPGPQAMGLGVGCQQDAKAPQEEDVGRLLSLCGSQAAASCRVGRSIRPTQLGAAPRHKSVRGIGPNLRNGCDTDGIIKGTGPLVLKSNPPLPISPGHMQGDKLSRDSCTLSRR